MQDASMHAAIKQRELCRREELLSIVQALCHALGTNRAASLPARVEELQKQTVAQPRLDRFVSDVCEVCTLP